MFKLGLDYHGVVDAIPSSLIYLAEAIIAYKGEVHILTGGRKKEVQEELMRHGFPYTHFFSVQDHLNKHHLHLNVGVNPKDGMMKYPDELWDCIKAWYCEKNQIDLHMDDTAEYGEYFTTPFARIWTKNNNPKRTDKPARHLK
jgi:hypothetical protein